MNNAPAKRMFRQEISSFCTKGRRLGAMDHGIRLRSDSIGSMKSAFYQGKIVSPSQNPDFNSSEDVNPTRRHHHSKPSTARTNTNTSPDLHQPNGETGHRSPADLYGDTPVYDAPSYYPEGSRFSIQRSVQVGLNPAGAATHGGKALRLAAGRVSVPAIKARLDPSELPRTSGLNHTGQRIPRSFGVSSSSSAHQRKPHGMLRGTSFVKDSASSLGGTAPCATSPSNDPPRAKSPSSENPVPSGAMSGFSNQSTWFQRQAQLLAFPNSPMKYSGASQFPNYGTSGAFLQDHTTPLQDSTFDLMNSDLSLDSSLFNEDEIDKDFKIKRTFSETLIDWFDPTEWLSADVRFDSDGTPYFEDASRWTVPGLVRALLYNPVYPEFTSMQQFSWAVIIGVFMGLYTAAWKLLIEKCVDWMWRAVPEMLLRWGVFTDLDGNFPVYHYMWIVPAVFGGTLSFIFASLSTPIPGQNEWIHSLHSRGIQDFETFGLLFLLSTAGMTSGLSLGPELPLILTSGMIGSWLAVLCKQSMLQARVLNLTAASAAIGGFFGFPMAGALFVLEVPHRMGLQYFEALTPATIASIVAVLTNRLATGNDVTGYYEYPFLNETLPSHIFKEAIIYGLFGCALGIVYTKVVLALKHSVHDLFHHVEVHNATDKHGVSPAGMDETIPLVGKFNQTEKGGDRNAENFSQSRPKLGCISISHKPLRAAISGCLVGIVVGITGIFIPHVMFWGEAQLQSLIDKGRTPLPVFGSEDEPTGGLVALGFCMGDHENGSVKSGFSLGCSATIVVAKIFVTGLSLGTGIIGGHFWAPLFAGCAASHFLTDLAGIVSSSLGFSSSLNAYPCVALLCIMGATHVVAFRAHVAIILILTLTIDAFDPKDDTGGGLKVAGDYSAVFPLLTVAVFVALQVSRQTVFYEKQRSRGDIMALPEVLCEPGKEGRPLVMDYEGNLHELDESDYEYETDTAAEDSELFGDTYRTIATETTQFDIEASFEAGKSTIVGDFDNSTLSTSDKKTDPLRKSSNSSSENSSIRLPSQLAPSPLPPRPHDSKPRRASNAADEKFTKPALRTLDDLLNIPIEELASKKITHRRTMSEPFRPDDSDQRSSQGTSRKSEEMSRSSDGGVPASPNKPPGPVALKRVSSFGQVDQERPCLLEQARRRAASVASDDMMRKMKHRSSLNAKPLRKNTS